MANQKRKVFHSSLTKTGWIVTEGGEMVSKNSSQKVNEAAAIAAGRKAYEDGGLGHWNGQGGWNRGWRGGHWRAGWAPGFALG
jgi:hypothetical protein